MDTLAPDATLPPVPEYRPFRGELPQSAAFAQLDALFRQRIALIDGAMGPMIQVQALPTSMGRADDVSSACLMKLHACVAVRACCASWQQIHAASPALTELITVAAAACSCTLMLVPSSLASPAS